MDIRRPTPANSRVSKEVSRAQSMEYSAQVRQKLAGDMGGITGTPNCQGWLLKESKGMLMSKWQKRYFALYGQRLLYWVEEDDFRCLFSPNIHRPDSSEIPRERPSNLRCLCALDYRGCSMRLV